MEIALHTKDEDRSPQRSMNLTLASNRLKMEVHLICIPFLTFYVQLLFFPRLL